VKRSDFFRGAWLSPLALVRGTGTLQDRSSTIDAQRDMVLAEMLATALDAFNVKSFGATGDGTTDDTAEIQAAIDASEAAGGGWVYFPVGTYRITATLNIPDTVSIMGVADVGSTIKPDDCDGLTFNFLRGFGRMVVRDINLQGMNGTTRRGIVAPGTSSDTDELYGLAIENVLIRNFNVAIHFRTVRNFSIHGCWIQDVNRGIELIGKNLGGRIFDNTLVLAAGSGTGARTGILLNSFSYAGPTIVAPEGIYIHNNQVFGFDECVDIVTANSVSITSNDLSGRIHGIQFQTVQNGFTIFDNFIEMSTSAALVGIRGKGVNSVLAAKIRIESNDILGAATTTSCAGIQINDAGNQNQNHVTILGNSIDGMDTYDILLNNPGAVSVIDNRCLSTGLSQHSISVGAVVLKPVYVERNFCADTVNTVDADSLSGDVVSRDNIINGTSRSGTDALDWYEEGTWTPVDSSGATLSFTAVNATYTRVGNVVEARCALTYPSTSDRTANAIGGLPYTTGSNSAALQGFISFTTAGVTLSPLPSSSGTTLSLRNTSGVRVANSVLSAAVFHICVRFTID
jgi:hypothetical protein